VSIRQALRIMDAQGIAERRQIMNMRDLTKQALAESDSVDRQGGQTVDVKANYRLRDFETGVMIPGYVDWLTVAPLVSFGLFVPANSDAPAPVAVVEHKDGSVFTPDDWQSAQPHSPSDIPDYRWVDSQGRLAVIVDGWPRIIA